MHIMYYLEPLYIYMVFELKRKNIYRISVKNKSVENIVADYSCLARELTYSLTIYDLNKIGKF